MAEGVSVRGLRKAFGVRTVLDGVDLDIASGSIAAVLGPSGCGKTTLLRIIAGFTEPDAGGVSVGIRTVTGVPAHRRRIGLLPQEGALFPYLSVGANIAFGLPRDGSVRERVAHWLEVVGLAGYHEAHPDELSGGQQQRVALARALAPEPEVVLLDEPFSALDAGLRIRVGEDIADILRATGTTAIFVTHDQSEALSLADSVALLIDGTVAQHAAPARLYGAPASLAAARFVGATIELAGRRCGDSVECALGVLPAAGDAPDGPVTVVVRPEQIDIAPGGLRATVRSVHFYGPLTGLRVELDDGTPIDLRSPSGCDAGSEIGLVVRNAVLTYPASPA